MVRQDYLEHRVLQQFRAHGGHLVDHQIAAGGLAQQVLAEAGVARDGDGTPAIVDAKAEGGVEQFAVVHGDGRHAHATLVVDHALLELGDLGTHRLELEPLVGNAGLNVPAISGGEAVHQGPRAHRAVDDERALALRIVRLQPTREPQVGNAHHMVRVQVGHEQRIHLAQLQARLAQALGGAAPAVDQQGLAAGLHQHAGAEAAHGGRRAASAQQRDAELVGCGRRWHGLRAHRQRRQARQRQRQPETTQTTKTTKMGSHVEASGAKRKSMRITGTAGPARPRRCAAAGSCSAA